VSEHANESVPLPDAFFERGFSPRDQALFFGDVALRYQPSRPPIAITPKGAYRVGVVDESPRNRRVRLLASAEKGVRLAVYVDEDSLETVTRHRTFLFATPDADPPAETTPGVWLPAGSAVRIVDERAERGVGHITFHARELDVTGFASRDALGHFYRTESGAPRSAIPATEHLELDTNTEWMAAPGGTIFARSSDRVGVAVLRSAGAFLLAEAKIDDVEVIGWVPEARAHRPSVLRARTTTSPTTR
jgi:hypothetical protein